MLVLELEGGTGDLFKFKTGAPFVGAIPEPAGAVSIGFAISLLCVRRRSA